MMFGHQPLNFVTGGLSGAPERLEELLGGNVGSTVKLTSRIRWPFYGRVCKWRAIHAVSLGILKTLYGAG
ncbi:hypothetical protein ABIE85_003593 [Bradyrhizobium diazoefficiens]|jgi:hypothetical protein|uniref:hypothetical protein n=1 Tax=Bradyrhizobium diazoefficiens TaxID=1355477 RepID=UPI001600B59F|nr:hypothetical protein [Bradyrhizobium diazoefficiens]WLA76812.1 hypothetical protein QIH77_17060 [Bradyrhizobium diazoefficiens]